MIGYSQLVAQTIKVNKLDVDDGLSNSEIRDIHTDKYGYKWIATGHGLNKYDGISFETFRYDPRDTLSIRANSQGQLFEDRDANIWVTIDIGGISKLDRTTGEFHYFDYKPEQGGHKNNFVQDALFDSQGRAWIGTYTNINLVDFERKRFEPVEVSEFSNLWVNSIYEDRSGTIWLGTESGLFRFNESLQVFEEVKDSSGESIISVKIFAEDKEDNVWLSAVDKGPYRLAPNESTPTLLPLPDMGAYNFVNSLFYTRESGLIATASRKGLFEWKNEKWEAIPLGDYDTRFLRYAYSHENNGNIFLFSYQNMGALFNYKEKRLTPIPNFSQPINAFWLDKNDKGLWLATMNFGLYQVTEVDSPFEKVTISDHPGSSSFSYTNFISNINVTSTDQVYFVGGVGLFEMDPKTGDMSQVIDYWKGDFHEGINSSVEFDKDHLLLATNGGIFKYHKRTRKIERFLELEERASEIVIKDDQLWAIGNFGLLQHDLEKGETLLFRDLKESPQLLQTNMTRKLYVDKEGVAWIGLVREGLMKVVKDDVGYHFEKFMYTGVREKGFLSHSINSIFEDASGRLWIGGFSSGLLEFDRKSREFTNHTPAGELPIPNVEAIQQADDGCLWISADNGLHKYNAQEGVFKRYTTQDGLTSNSFVLRSSARLQDGQMLFGTNHGITMFQPDEVDLPEEVPEVIIENINLFNKSLDLDQPVQEVEEIRLKHAQNFLSLDVIALDFTKSDLVTYAYKMDGLTEDWVNISNTRTVNFNNLKPGYYELQVRATINNGVWGKPTKLSIFIDSPFWLKPWFFSLVVAFIIGVLWLLHQYRLHEKLRRINVMAEVRQKAAADFHDEMGNKLTRIALFTDVLKKKLNSSSEEVTAYIDKIRDNSRSLNSSMRDFLWALDPKKDSAYDVAVMLKDFGEELFDKTQVEFNVESIESDLQRYKLEMDWKRNIIMIFKEAMHNVLKHANATKAYLNFILKQDELLIQLTDNGEGLRNDKEIEGYGLRNMTYRTKELAGTLNIENQDKGGTSVKFIGNLKAFAL